MELLLSIVNAPIVCVVIGTCIGACIGAYLTRRMSDSKDIRNTAIKALNIFKQYEKGSYKEAENAFNRLNIIERRKIIVGLQKMGIPFYVASKDTVTIDNIHLKDEIIDGDRIREMIRQIKKGRCDYLFFGDIEFYFSLNHRISVIRDVGKKYVREVLAQSYVNQNSEIVCPCYWEKTFSPGEMSLIAMLRFKLWDRYYFLPNGKSDPSKIENLIKEIDIGIWDYCLSEDFELQMTRFYTCNLWRVLIKAKQKPKTEKEES